MKTIKEQKTNTIIVNKSKFIAIALPLNSADDFKEILKPITKEHRKATHIVYAYRSNNQSKSTDDGEPKGTAGHPILDFLYKKELNNIAIIVIRYFGGTKLGASYLLRTYLQAAIDVTNLCEIIEL